MKSQHSKSKSKIYRCSDGVDRVASGEVRRPERGEWYLSKPFSKPLLNEYELEIPSRTILVPVRKAKPVAPKPDEFTRAAVLLAEHAAKVLSEGYYKRLARRVSRLAKERGAK